MIALQAALRRPQGVGSALDGRTQGLLKIRGGKSAPAKFGDVWGNPEDGKVDKLTCKSLTDQWSTWHSCCSLELRNDKIEKDCIRGRLHAYYFVYDFVFNNLHANRRVLRPHFRKHVSLKKYLKLNA